MAECDNCDRAYEAGVKDGESRDPSAGDAGRESDAWRATAAQNQRNADYYRGLVDEIGKLFGREAYRADDHEMSDDILRAKVPDLVRAALEDAPAPVACTWNGDNEACPETSVAIVGPTHQRLCRSHAGQAYETIPTTWDSPPVATKERPMLKIQSDVQDFHRALDIPIGERPTNLCPERVELRISLIEEEARETAEALRAGDMLEAVDGLADLIYVAIGAAVELGVNLEAVWDEVQRANMAKVGGPVRADGKRLKPEGWTAPNHAPALLAQGWEK